MNAWTTLHTHTHPFKTVNLQKVRCKDDTYDSNPETKRQSKIVPGSHHRKIKKEATLWDWLRHLHSLNAFTAQAVLQHLVSAPEAHSELATIQQLAC